MTRQEVRQKIQQLQKQLDEAQEEEHEIVAAELRSKLGVDASCKNCRYGCTYEPTMRGDICLQDQYMKIKLCNAYKSDNILSSHIREHNSNCFRMNDISSGLIYLFGDMYIGREDIANEIINIVDLALRNGGVYNGGS